MIDWQRVQELQDEIGPDDMQEVIELFVLEVEEALVELKPTLNAKDLAKALHFLKGCSMNIGFQVVVNLCRHLEDAAANGAIRPEDLQNLKTTFQESRLKFEADFHKMMVYHHRADHDVRKESA